VTRRPRRTTVPESSATVPVTIREVVDSAFAGFEAWYLREHPKVVAALTWVAGDPHVAADATDEAFARAYANWHKVERMDSPGGWVYRVALNVVRRRIRRAAFEQRTVEPPAEVAQVVDREIWTVVQQLPDRQRVGRRTAVPTGSPRAGGGNSHGHLARHGRVRLGRRPAATH
jgi:hypothetical protein